MIIGAICHENQSRPRQPQDQLITTPTRPIKTSITCLFIYGNFYLLFSPHLQLSLPARARRAY